ncbi:MAG: PilZ domain-containing protein [Planctomycetota bacterium]
MNRSPSNPKLVGIWRRLLDEAAAQNGPVELVPVTEQGRELPRVRARLLRSGPDGTLVVEMPSGQPQAEALRKGVAVDVVVTTDATRMKARSSVADLGRFKLNEQTRVLAVRLTAVTGVASAQRRACYRLSTAGLGLAVELTCPEWPTGWPEDQDPVRARAVDLSDRGLGLTVKLPLEWAEKMKSRLFDAAIWLPGEAEPLEVPVRVVRAFENLQKTVTLGLQFEFPTPVQQRRAERVIQQFSVEQQRRQLRRTRGAG